MNIKTTRRLAVLLAALMMIAAYIELNPVRAAMIEHPADYPWSSCRANTLGEEDSLLTAHRIYRRLGRSDNERQSAYRQLFRAHLPKADIEAIRQATNKAWALGNDRFRAKIEALGARRTSPLPRGRPITEK